MVSFSDEAIADLVAIRDWIARSNPKLAREKMLAIREKCRILDTSPRIGRPGQDGKRELTTAYPWVIVYEIRETGPYVLRIWHEGQSRETLTR